MAVVAFGRRAGHEGARDGCANRFSTNVRCNTCTMPTETFFRFVTDQRLPPDGHRTGLFQAAYQLWHDSSLPMVERAELRELLDWFNSNLDRPTQLATSRRSHPNETPVFWICGSAAWHVAHLRRLAALVKQAGIAVDEVETTQPGRVVYRDAHQVVAFASADTPQ